MEAQVLSVATRIANGKGGARKVRASGKIPAIMYGMHTAPVSVVCDPVLLRAVVKGKRGRNTVFSLQLDSGESVLAMLQDLQVHPVSRALLHADFIRVSEDHAVDVKVPFHTDGRAAGVVAGGMLRQLIRTLPVRCLPQHIPEELRADVSGLEIGAFLSVGDLRLPEGVTVALPTTQHLATVEK